MTTMILAPCRLERFSYCLGVPRQFLGQGTGQIRTGLQQRFYTGIIRKRLTVTLVKPSPSAAKRITRVGKC